jgi:hypothetical protein
MNSTLCHDDRSLLRSHVLRSCRTNLLRNRWRRLRRQLGGLGATSGQPQRERLVQCPAKHSIHIIVHHYAGRRRERARVFSARITFS